MGVRGVWDRVDFVFLFSSRTLFPWWTPGCHGLADRTLHLGLIHTFSSTLLLVMMEMESEGLIERERDTEGEVWGREKVWSGIVELSRQVWMHWFRITFLFHFDKRMLPFWANAILISRLRPNICTIQIGGYGGNAIQTWNMALSSYPAQPHWCFFEPFIAQPKWSLSELELLTD